MSWVRRARPKELREHVCRKPMGEARWLPWIVWPRWREGAVWQCGREVYNYSTEPTLIGGCGKFYRWEIERGYDAVGYGWNEVERIS